MSNTKPIHPGEVLFEVYMKPAAPPLTVEMLAKTLRVPVSFVTGLINGRRTITPSMAMRLGVICRTTAEYWLGLQRSYDAQACSTTDPRRRYSSAAA